MNLFETETSYYETFDLNDLDRVADAVAEAFINSDPTDPRRDRGTMVCKRACRLR